MHEAPKEVRGKAPKGVREKKGYIYTYIRYQRRG